MLQAQARRVDLPADTEELHAGRVPEAVEVVACEERVPADGSLDQKVANGAGKRLKRLRPPSSSVSLRISRLVCSFVSRR